MSIKIVVRLHLENNCFSMINIQYKSKKDIFVTPRNHILYSILFPRNDENIKLI